MQNYFILFLVIIIYLCSYEVQLLNAHVASSCYSIPNTEVIYTRSTGYTDDFYVWVSSYHTQGTGCYTYYGYYEEQRLVVTINGKPVTREGTTGSTCSANTISSFYGNYPNNGNENMGGSPARIQDKQCYDTYTAKYLGQGDDYLKRSHCSGGQGFMGLWFELLPVRLRAMDKTNQNTQTINKVSFRGWGCEGVWVDKDYTVQYGCPKGTWEDTSPSTAWSDTSSASYCKPCPAGYYSIHANANIQKGTSGQAACTACPKGKFGDENQYPNRDTADYCQACPAGRYGDEDAMSDSQCKGECKKGFYCPSNVLNTHAYGGTPSSNPPQLEITAGHYGAAGSTSATPHVCPAGYFCPQGSGDTDCTSATAWTSSTLKDSRCKHLCGQGSGCEQNVNVKSSTCYCPSGSTTPLFIDPGFYSSGSGKDDNVVMTRDTQTPCNPPNYCLGGTCNGANCDGWYHPCPAGKYGSTTGIKHAGGITDPNNANYNSQCLPCQAGYRCAEGSNKATAATCGTGNETQKYYCPEGTGATAITVDANKITVCPPTSPNGANCATNVREAQADCPAGYSCQNGEAKSVKWQDSNGLGICKIKNQLDPKVGEGSGQIPEKSNDAQVMGRDSSGTWVETNFDVRARNINDGNIPDGGFTISTETCLQGTLKDTTTNHFNMVSGFVKSNQALDTITCTKYSLTITATDSTVSPNPTGTCTLVIEVTNVNDAPSYIPLGLVDRAIYERSSVGSRANRAAVLGSDSKYSMGDVVTSALTSDPDVGQDVFYSLEFAYPTISNETFGVSKCSGDVYVKKSTPMLNYIDNTVHYLCISACDDPSFFGDRTESLYTSKCAPSPTYTSVNTSCGSTTFKNNCDAKNGFCLPIRIIDVNDPPEFNYTAVECTGPNDPCYIDEQVAYNTPVANVANQASDLDNDPLRWSILCLSCPTVSVSSVQRTNPAKVITSTNSFKTGDRVSFSGVSGMVEINSDYRLKVNNAYVSSTYEITVVDSQTFTLNGFDGTSLPSLVVGTSGTVALAPFDVMNGQFTTNLPAASLTYLPSNSFSLEVTVQDPEFEVKKQFQLKLRDVNDPPTFPTNIPTLTVAENYQGNISGIFYASDQDDTGSTANTLTYTTTTPGWNAITSCTGGLCACQLKTTANLDYEASSTKTRTVSVTVTDNGLPNSADCTTANCKDAKNVTGTVTVNVLDVNEPPEVAPTVAKSIAETPLRKVSGSTSAGNEVWEVDTSKAGTVAGTIVVDTSDYNYTDPESSSVKSFAFDTDATHIEYSCFNINAFTGVITLKANTYLDTTTDSTSNIGCNANVNALKFTVKVSDDTIENTVTTNFTLTITNVDEDPYFTEMFTQSPYVQSINETTSDTLYYSGTIQDLKAITKDPENETLTFSLISGYTYSGEDNTTGTVTQFELDSATGGLLKVASTSRLNYEESQSYVVGFNVTDPGMNSGNSEVSVALNDMNDPPTLNTTTVLSDQDSWLTIIEHDEANTCTNSSSSAVGCKGGTKTVKLTNLYTPTDDLKKDEDAAILNNVANTNYQFVYQIVSQKYEASTSSLGGWNTTKECFEIDANTGVISVKSSYADQAAITTNCPELRNKNGGFRIEVQIRNNQATEPKTSAASVYAYIKIIDHNSVPYFLNLPATIYIDETTVSNTAIFTVTAIDDDSTITFRPIAAAIPTNTGDTLIYTNGKITGNSASNMGDSTSVILSPNVPFSIDASSGQIKLTTSGIDYERGGYAWNANAVANVTVEIDITDGVSVVTSYLYVIIKNKNEAPVFKNTLYPYTASAWENAGASHQLEITANKQNNEFIALDVDTSDRYETTVSNWGNVNANRPKCGIASSKCSYAVTAIVAKKSGNAVTDATILTTNKLKTTDFSASSFINENYDQVKLQLGASLNFEEISSVIFTITVTDSGSNTVSTDVTLTVKDRNEPPILTLSELKVQENFPINTKLSMDFTSYTTDPDAVFNFNYTINSEDCVYDGEEATNPRMFAIDTGTTVLKLDSTPLDFENCEMYKLSITVHDQGNGVAGEASLSATVNNFIISIQDINDISSASTNGTLYNSLETPGGDDIIIVGSNFGPTKAKVTKMTNVSKPTPVVKYGPDANNLDYTATGCSIDADFCDATYCLGNQVIRCKTVSGVGKNHKIQITINGVTNVLSSDPLSYKAPIITNVPGFNSMATGTPTQIYIDGANFGDGVGSNHLVTVQYANNNGQLYNAVGCTPTTHTRISCKSAEGSGTELQWAVTVGSQTSAQFPVNPVLNVSSYKKSTISAVYIENALVSGTSPKLNGVGGQNLEIVGSYFGPTITTNKDTVKLQYGLKNSDQTVKYEVGCSVSNHTRLFCESAPGVGTGHILRAVVNGLIGVWTNASAVQLNYKLPIITSVSGPGAIASPTTGNVGIFIYGEHFGPSFTNVRASPCTIMTPPSSSPDEQNAKEYANLQIKYGIPSNPIYNGQCCIVHSDKFMECKTDEGVGKDHAWKVNVGGQDSNLYRANTSYSPPVVRDYGEVNVNIQQFITQGGQFVEILGKNYGPNMDGVNKITYGEGKGLEYDVNVSDCTMQTKHEKIRCKMVPGAGKKLKWVLIIGKQQSVYPTTAYGPPRIDSVKSSNNNQVMKQQGGEEIVITGINFGPLKYTVKVTYGQAGQYYDGLDCQITVHSTQIKCKSSPGIGGPHFWYVTVRSQQSAKSSAATAMTSYEEPFLYELKPKNAPTSGINGVELIGKNLGSYAKDGTINNVEVLLDGVAIPNDNRAITRVPPTTNGGNASLEFNIGDGFNAGHSIAVRLTSPDKEVVVSTNALTFDYDPPTISTIRVEDFAGAYPGERKITVTGTNFCANSACGTLFVNNVSTPSISHTHTEIVAHITAKGGKVKVKVGDGSKARETNEKEFAELAPVLSSENKTALDQMTGFTTQPYDDLLWIAGTELDSLAHKLCVTVGDCPVRTSATCDYNDFCDPSNPSGGRMANVTHTVRKFGPGSEIITVAFQLPTGAGRNQELLLWKGDQPSSGKVRLFLHFDPPTITNNKIFVKSSNQELTQIATNGFNELIRITGTNLGDKYLGKLVFGLVSSSNGNGNRRLLSAIQRRRKLLSSTQSTVCTIGNIFCESENKCKPSGQVCAVDLVKAGMVSSWTHDTIEFELPEGQNGTGTQVYLNLEVGKQRTGSDDIILSYNAPTISRVELPGSSNPPIGPTVGGTRLKVVGTNFGCPKTQVCTASGCSSNTLCQGGQTAKLFSGLPGYYEYACPIELATVAHTVMYCNTLEGEGKGLTMQANIAGRVTQPKDNVFSYGEPTISKISRSDSPTSALENNEKILVTIEGTNFGPPDSKSITHLVIDCNNVDGNGPSENCKNGRIAKLNHSASGWEKNHTHLSFHIPEGFGQKLEISIVVGGSKSTNSMPFSYLNPIITEVLTLDGPTDGCGADQWEDLQAWRVRIDDVSPDEKRLNPQKYARRCKAWKMMKIKGDNFGPSSNHVQVWMGECSDFKTKVGCDLIDNSICFWSGVKCSKPAEASSGELRKRTGPFVAFDGVNLPTTSSLNCADPQSRQEYCTCETRKTFSHNEVNVCSPVGFGKNLSIVLSVFGNEVLNSSLKYNFYRPKITSSQPKPYDARGEDIVVRGSDFGGVESPASVLLHNRVCSDSKWHKAHEEDGLPYVSCKAPSTVVGTKNISVTVALQTSETVVALKSVHNSIAYSICKMGETNDDGRTDIYWGRPGEVCTICKVGATCKPNTMLEPNSTTGYWRENLDITAVTPLDDVDDIMSQKAGDDILRASTRCPPERLLTDAIKASHPNAKQREKCFDFVSCIPQEACLGKNRCEKEYLHEELNCKTYDSKVRSDSGDNPELSPLLSCEVDLQCRSRSGGETCVKAIKDVCQCGPQWEKVYTGLSCLKSCIRDAAKSALLTGACGTLKGRQADVISNLQSVMARSECGRDNPEDCSYCVPRVNSTTGKTYGVCECSAGYRCSLCTSGTHYRIDNKCEECPQSPGLIIALFVIGIIFAIIGLYELDKRKFNLAFVNIGWDYFQVLSMFTDADVRWPAALKSLYRFFSLFSFDIDIVAPECLVPNFPYQLKFWMTILSPIACGIALIIVLLLSTCHMLCWKGIKWSNRDKTLTARLFTAPFLMMLYFLYVTVTRKAFDIFNCNPLPGDAHDGYLYTSFTSFECDSGPCRCDDPRHIQVGLKVPAAVTIIVMTIGFPLTMFILLRSKKWSIKMDQLLRAADVGDTLESSANAEAFQTRLAYHKMYYHFLPGKTYWITYIILRKGAIAAAALTFRANPGFQLAFVLLILFIAYVMQVKHKPYMSTVARDHALADHAEKVEMGDKDHILIAGKIKKAREFKKMKEKRNKVRKKGIKLGDKKQQQSLKQKERKQHVYFWDYNTVEQVLLACAILVALAGVMFESDRFINDKTNAFAWQREMITYIIIIIVISSLVYYFVVFFSELYGKIPDWAQKLAGKLKQSRLARYGNSMHSKHDLSFHNNPLMAGDAVKLQKHKENADKAVATRDKQIEQQQQQNQMLMERLRNAKKNAGQASGFVKNPFGNKRKNKVNKKKQFTPTRLRDDSAAVEMAPIRNNR